MNKEFRDAIYKSCYPYGLLVENSIYYYCFSNWSKYKIPGYDQEDLAQELLIKAVKAIPKYDPDKKFMPWINTVLKRQLITMWRKQNQSRDVYNKCEIYSFFINED